MNKAYKYRIRPNVKQQEMLNHFFGCTRYVYNIALSTKITAYESNKTKLSFIDLCNQLRDAKKESELSFLKDAPSQALNQSIKNMDSAFRGFFKGKGYPNFKSKHGKQSIGFPQHVSVDFENKRIKFPKLGKVKCHFDRIFDLKENKIKTCTITKTKTGKYYVSVLVENKDEFPEKENIQEHTSVGLDLGIKNFSISSDGEVTEKQRYLIKALKKLRVEQRSLSRKKKGSNRREKQKLVVAKIYERVTNLRKNFLHQLSTKIVREYDTIILEDLNVKGMIKNRKLAKHIADQSWSMFVGFVKYKCDWHGKNFIQVNRWFPSSKSCGCCGYINKGLKLSDRFWECPECYTVLDRDINAAINIKKEGLRLALHSLTQDISSNVECETHSIPLAVGVR